MPFLAQCNQPTKYSKVYFLMLFQLNRRLRSYHKRLMARRNSRRQEELPSEQATVAGGGEQSAVASATQAAGPENFLTGLVQPEVALLLEPRRLPDSTSRQVEEIKSSEENLHGLNHSLLNSWESNTAASMPPPFSTRQTMLSEGSNSLQSIFSLPAQPEEGNSSPSVPQSPVPAPTAWWCHPTLLPCKSILQDQHTAFCREYWILDKMWR